jgi:hypothetical protein
MPEPSKFSLKESALADGTVDFYVMLNEPQDAPVDGIKAKINSLYSEAQANRDHRNLTRRKEYQALLDMLPWARTALLDADKRQRYDAYLAAARTGTNSPEFPEFMDDLMGLNDPLDDGKTGLPGIKDKPAADKTPRVIKATVQPAAKTPAKATPSAAAKAGPPAAAVGGGIGGLIIGLGLGLVILHNIVPAILVGIILGALLFVVLNKKPNRKIGV